MKVTSKTGAKKIIITLTEDEAKKLGALCDAVAWSSEEQDEMTGMGFFESLRNGIEGELEDLLQCADEVFMIDRDSANASTCLLVRGEDV